MTERTAPRVLVIGLDSIDPNLLLEWCAQGRLPNIARLKQRSAWGRLRSPDGLGDEAVWASFATCLPPGEHGRYHHLGSGPGSYEQPRIRAKHFKHPSFWQAIDTAGKRVVVLDVPKSPHAKLANGIAVYDWRVHGVDGQPASDPPEVVEKLLQRFGIDGTDRPGGIHYCNERKLNESERAEWLRLLHAGIEDKTRVSLEYLNTSCDLFLAVFKESHCAGHLCWPPDSDLEAIVLSLDLTVGKLLECADEDTTVIVFSGHGMGHNYHGNDLLNAVLRQLERKWSSPWDNLAIALDVLYHRVRNRLGWPAKTSRHRRRWAYQLDHNEIAGAVKINLLGREPNGRVAPGRELEAFYDYLESEFLALSDIDTGKPVVDRVLRMDTEQKGSMRHRLPDLLVVWSRERPIRAVCSATIGTIKNPGQEERPGNHISGGLYIAAGPGVCKGEASEVADITDLGVTIAALNGVTVPNVTGQVIRSICPDESADPSSLKSGF